MSQKLKQAKLAGWGPFTARRNRPDTLVSRVDAGTPLPPLSPLAPSLSSSSCYLFTWPQSASVAKKGQGSRGSRAACLRENVSLIKTSR